MGVSEGDRVYFKEFAFETLRGGAGLARSFADGRSGCDVKFWGCASGIVVKVMSESTKRYQVILDAEYRTILTGKSYTPDVVYLTEDNLVLV